MVLKLLTPTKQASLFFTILIVVYTWGLLSETSGEGSKAWNQNNGILKRDANLADSGFANSLVTDSVDVDGDATIEMKCDGGNILDLLTGEISDNVTQPPPMDAWDASLTSQSSPSSSTSNPKQDFLSSATCGGFGGLKNWSEASFSIRGVDTLPWNIIKRRHFKQLVGSYCAMDQHFLDLTPLYHFVQLVWMLKKQTDGKVVKIFVQPVRPEQEWTILLSPENRHKRSKAN